MLVCDARLSPLYYKPSANSYLSSVNNPLDPSKERAICELQESDLGTASNRQPAVDSSPAAMSDMAGVSTSPLLPREEGGDAPTPSPLMAAGDYLVAIGGDRALLSRWTCSTTARPPTVYASGLVGQAHEHYFYNEEGVQFRSYREIAVHFGLEQPARKVRAGSGISSGSGVLDAEGIDGALWPGAAVEGWTVSSDSHDKYVSPEGGRFHNRDDFWAHVAAVAAPVSGELDAAGIDGALWPGSAAQGWTVLRRGDSHYKYVSPEGERFRNRNDVWAHVAAAAALVSEELDTAGIDSKLCAGAAADGWTVQKRPGSHYKYSSPDGEFFTNRGDAKARAAFAAPAPALPTRKSEQSIKRPRWMQYQTAEVDAAANARREREGAVCRARADPTGRLEPGAGG